MQADLFNAAPQPTAARLPSARREAAGAAPDGRGKRDTSRAAYANVELSVREAEVMRYILAHTRPGWDWTRAELARAMGWRDGPMCGRVNALIAKGRLIEGPVRACRVGKAGHSVRPA